MLPFLARNRLRLCRLLRRILLRGLDWMARVDSRPMKIRLCLVGRQALWLMEVYFPFIVINVGFLANVPKLGLLPVMALFLSLEPRQSTSSSTPKPTTATPARMISTRRSDASSTTHSQRASTRSKTRHWKTRLPSLNAPQSTSGTRRARSELYPPTNASLVPAKGSTTLSSQP